jgi:hypothetical protein
MIAAILHVLSKLDNKKDFKDRFLVKIRLLSRTAGDLSKKGSSQSTRELLSVVPHCCSGCRDGKVRCY